MTVSDEGRLAELKRDGSGGGLPHSGGVPLVGRMWCCCL